MLARLGWSDADLEFTASSASRHPNNEQTMDQTANDLARHMAPPEAT